MRLGSGVVSAPATMAAGAPFDGRCSIDASLIALFTEGVRNEIEDQLLPLDQDDPAAVGRVPPRGRVEVGMRRRTHRGLGADGLERTRRHATDATRVIGRGDHQHRAQPVRAAPCRQGLRVCPRAAAGRQVGHARHVHHAEPGQHGGLLRRARARHEAAPCDFPLGRPESFVEEDHLRGDACLDEIGGLERAGHVGIERHGDGVDALERIVHHQRGAERAQRAFPHGGCGEHGAQRQRGGEAVPGAPTPRTHRWPQATRRAAARMPSAKRAHRGCGRSCPMPSMTSSCAPPMRRDRSWPQPTGTSGSAAP